MTKASRVYKILSNQVIENGEYKLVPIRHEDRFNIMKWRNEQIYHLRQKEPLTVEKQDHYFTTVIESLFTENEPEQILFSLLKGDECIGYGGLVHINWIDMNGEVSFIMNTRLEKASFSKNWSIFLGFIEQVAFGELGLHKIFIYAFDLRPHLYDVLELNDYFLDARLKSHCYSESQFVDVLIYSKIVNR